MSKETFYDSQMVFLWELHHPVDEKEPVYPGEGR
jgi:hypothetical protein